MGSGVPISLVRYSCDVSFMNLTPLGNTRLLRSYVALEPQVQILALAVKRWAKTMGMAKTWDGFISSYAWTCLVIYYLQVSHGLPSLHLVAASAVDSEVDPTVFADDLDPEAGWRELADGPGGLLEGFFHFYASEYRWGEDREFTKGGLVVGV